VVVLTPGEEMIHCSCFSDYCTGLLAEPALQRFERLLDELIRHGLGAEGNGFSECHQCRAAKNDGLVCMWVDRLARAERREARRGEHEQETRCGKSWSWR
jgi:hypothetical protein